MEKTLAMKRAEFMQRLAGVINSSELPPFVLADVMQITLASVQSLANERLEKDIKEYEDAFNAEKDGD